MLEDDETADEMEGMYLRLRCSDRDYALPVRYVSEIIALPELTSVPNAPEYIRGVLNLRGRIVPAIDLRLRLHEEAGEYTARTCVVVIERGESLLSLIVDGVSEVLRLSPEAQEAPPAAPLGRSARFITGMVQHGQAVLILLDIEELLRLEELDTAALPAPADSAMPTVAE